MDLPPMRIKAITFYNCLLRLPFALFACCAAALLVNTAALAQQPKLATLQGDFKEALNTDVVVSGGVIVGIDGNGPFNGARLTRLIIRPGTTSTPRAVCLRVVSRDGAYTASNNYVVPADIGANEAVSLPYLSRYLDRLGEYGDTEIAVSATMGECEADDGTYAIIHSGSQPLKQLRLFVNSFNATDVYLTTSLGEEVSCEPLQGRRTSFDFVCEWPWPDTSPASINLTVKREVFGRALSPATITVLHGSES